MPLLDDNEGCDYPQIRPAFSLPFAVSLRCGARAAFVRCGAHAEAYAEPTRSLRGAYAEPTQAYAERVRGVTDCTRGVTPVGGRNK